MNDDVRNEVVAETKELIKAVTCSAETKEAAQAWLDAIGTPQEESETKKYLQELEEDIMPIDQLIAFASSDEGKSYFKEEIAAGIVAHANEIKANGAIYCDCPACTIVEKILSKKEKLLK